MDIRFTTQDGVVFCESALEGEKIQEIKEIEGQKSSDIPTQMDAPRAKVGTVAVLLKTQKAWLRLIFTN